MRTKCATLGRALDNDIVLLDIAASRKHAQVIRGELGFSLLDLRSANGVFLNGRRITEEELYDGDEIEVGETVLRFESLGEIRERITLDDDTSPGVEPMMQIQPAFQRAALPQPDLTSPSAPQLPPLPMTSSHQVQERPQVQSSLEGSARHQRPKKEMHVTYGFGSQWSEEDLGVNKAVYSPPAVERLPWKAKILDFIYRARVEVLFGQGRTANILRSSLALGILVIFFSFGHLIKKVTSSLTDQVNSTNPVSVSQSSSPNVDGDKASKDREMLGEVIDEITRKAETLISQGEWRESLKQLNAASPRIQSAYSSRLEALKNEAEQGLVNSKLPAIRGSISRGRLKRAREDHDRLVDGLSPQALAQVVPVTFSLWLHQRELGDLSRFNPPPREQRSLDRSAQEQLRGDTRSALKTLKRARISKSRQALVKLRRESVKAASTKKSSGGDLMRRRELPVGHHECGVMNAFVHAHATYIAGACACLS